jgi:hypothetical protein
MSAFRAALLATFLFAIFGLRLAATEPASTYNVPGQKRTRNCTMMASNTAALRFPDGTPTGFYAYGDDPSKNGSGNDCAIGSTEMDAQEAIVTTSGLEMYFRPGGGPDQYVDYINKGQYGHIWYAELANRPPVQPQNLNGKPCAAVTAASNHFALNLIGVADDGAIYSGNVSSATFPPQFVLYRWANETAPQTIVFSGDPGNNLTNAFGASWGDTIAVRGAGTNTQVLLTSHGSVAAVLRPKDATMTSFTSTLLATDASAGAIGAGIAFGSGNTFWAVGDSGSGPLLRLSFDLNSGTATTVQSVAADFFPWTVSALAFISSANLLAALDTPGGPDLVRLYDVSNTSVPPVLLDRRPWPFNNENTNHTGTLVFAGTNELCVLDSDNGIMAYTIASVATNAMAPAIYSQPADVSAGASDLVSFSVGADGSTPLSYRWQFNGADLETATAATLNVSAQPANVGSYRAIVTNAFGAATSAIANVNITGFVASDLLDYEPFAYPSGSVLAGQGGWLLNSGSSGTVQPGSFIMPMLPPALGNHFSWTSSSMSLRLPIGTHTDGDVYFSLVLRVNSVGVGGSDTIAGFTTGSATTFSPKLNIASNAPGAYNLGLYKSSGLTTGNLTTNIFRTNEAIFVVARYRFNNTSGTDDTCDLWLNPSTSTFGAAFPPAPTLADVGAGAGRTDLNPIDRFFFRSAAPAQLIEADELRVGTTWASVVPLFRPTLSFLLAGAVGTLLWPTNASEYQLEQSSALAGNDWTTVTNNKVIVGTNFSVALPVGSASSFYRLRL